MNRLSIELLGPPLIKFHSTILRELGNGKAFALFCYLVANAGIPFTRERLCAVFWPELDATSARNNLRKTLFHIRFLLEDSNRTSTPFIIPERNIVQFNPHYQACTDIFKFMQPYPFCDLACGITKESCTKRMIEMASLYRGSFLSGLSLSISEEFDEWVDATRLQLSTRAELIHSKIINCSIKYNLFNQALRYASRAIEINPDNERNYHRAISLCLLNREGDAALTYFDMYIKAMENLGATPKTIDMFIAENSITSTSNIK